MGMHPNYSWLLTQPVPMPGGGSHLLPGFGQFSISKWFHQRQRAWLKWLEPSSVRSTWREPRNSESSPLYQEYCDLGWSENGVLQWFLDDLSPFCQRTLQFWSIQTSNFQTYPSMICWGGSATRFPLFRWEKWYGSSMADDRCWSGSCWKVQLIPTTRHGSRQPSIKISRAQVTQVTAVDLGWLTLEIGLWFSSFS